jgi:adenylosuccinate synthase
MGVVAILGAQWGDEGKGKIAQILSEGMSVCARPQGGANAGHTVYNGNRDKIVFRSVPTGILSADNAVIGNGCAFNLKILMDEIQYLESNGVDVKSKLLISSNAHIILDEHLDRDRGTISQRIGTTKMGIGPCYADKIARSGVRIGDAYNDCLLKPLADSDKILRDKFYHEYSTLLVDTGLFLRARLSANQTIISEGAQGRMLDIDHGDYPFVTSTNTTVGGVISGLGVPASAIEDVYLVASIYMTKVGNGPFSSKFEGNDATLIQNAGEEVDGATNLLRDIGWLDLDALKTSVEINGATGIILTRLDVVSLLGFVKFVKGGKPEIVAKWSERDVKNITQELPVVFEPILNEVEEYCGCPVVAVSTGKY